jgi:hypothetical protein
MGYSYGAAVTTILDVDTYAIQETSKANIKRDTCRFLRGLDTSAAVIHYEAKINAINKDVERARILCVGWGH